MVLDMHEGVSGTKICVTGGTGFIGTALCHELLQHEYEVNVLTRDTHRAEQHLDRRVKAVVSLRDLNPDDTPGIIINLAGQSLGSGRWTKALKQTFLSSRIGTTARIIDHIVESPTKPRVLISGSAVGYYGARGDEILNENSTPGDEFQADLCRDWEAEAGRAKDLGVRVCVLRMGVVLGKDGGALSSLLPPFKLGLGGQLGDGKQWVSWIHMDDLVGIILHLMEQENLSGTFNATAPNPETNRDFATKLGKVLRRPTFVRVPGWAVRIQVGEMARLFLTGQKVLPQRLIASGYEFQYPELGLALTRSIG